MAGFDINPEKKAGRYKHPPALPPRPWTPEEDEALFRVVCAARNRGVFGRLCRLLCQEFRRVPGPCHHARYMTLSLQTKHCTNLISNRIWDVVTTPARAAPWTSADRGDENLTFGEARFVYAKWAESPDPDKHPDPALYCFRPAGSMAGIEDLGEPDETVLPVGEGPWSVKLTYQLGFLEATAPPAGKLGALSEIRKLTRWGLS